MAAAQETIAVVIKGVDDSKAAFASLNANAKRATGNVVNMQRASQAMGRGMRSQIQQASYQVQDIAVQLQAGQNAMTVFAQQGSQLASIMGPGGAVVGGIIAVAGAVAGALIPSLIGGAAKLDAAKEAMESLREEAERLQNLGAIGFANELDAAGDKVEKAQKRLEALQLAAELELDKPIKDQQDFSAEITNAEAAVVNAQAALDKLNKSFKFVGEESEKAGKKVGDSVPKYETLEDQLKELDAAYRQFETPAEKLVRQYKEADEFLRKYNTETELHGRMIAAALEQYKKSTEVKTKEVEATKELGKTYKELLGQFDDSQAAYNAYYRQVNEISEAQATNAEKATLMNSAWVELQRTLNPAIQDMKEIKDATDEATTELGKYAAESEELAKSLDSGALRAVKGLEDGFVDLISGTKSVSDSFRDMANNVINELIRIQVQRSITRPLSGLLDTAIGSFFGGGASIPGATTASPGIGAGDYMPYQPRALGGPVKGNSAYLVGEKGPELFVPNTAGNIVDNNAISTGETVVVNQTINVSTGVQQTVRAEIANLMPQITEATKSAVAEARMRGGSYSKALTGA